MQNHACAIRCSGLAAAIVFSFTTLFCTGSLPAAAQDVIIVPKNKDDKKDDKPKSDNSWLNFVTPKPERDKDKRQTSKANPPKSDVPKGVPAIVVPKTDKKVVAPSLPVEAEEAPSIASNELSNVLLKMKERPTQVIQQAEYSPSKERKFANEVSIKISKLNFSASDLEKTAEGTALKPDELLKSCEPRFSGVVLGHENAGVDFEVRGMDGSGSAGYEKALNSVHVVLSLACKLAAPPRNKGTIPKMGEYYLLGLAQGGCTPVKPVTSGTARIALTYTGGDAINCEVGN